MMDMIMREIDNNNNNGSYSNLSLFSGLLIICDS